MKIPVKVVHGVVVIRPRGELKGGPETHALRAEISTRLEKGKQKLLIDFSKVKWMNSHGIGMLMACYARSRDTGGRIGLAKVPDRVMQVMHITKIESLFDCYVSLRHAIREYHGLDLEK